MNRITKLPPIKSKTRLEQGQALVDYALILILVALSAIIALTLMGTNLSAAFSKVNAGFNPEDIPSDKMVVHVIDQAGKGIANVRVYGLNGKGWYIGQTGTTNESGDLIFDEWSDGDYQFLTNYRGHQYRSALVAWPNQRQAVIQTGQRSFTIRVIDDVGTGIENVRLYAFNAQKQYVGLYGNTDSAGSLQMDLPDGSFTFRADYRGHQYWSDQADTPKENTAVVETGERPFTVQVVDAQGNGLNDVRVYAFNAQKQYVSLHGNTDTEGNLQLNIPTGSFTFRADYRGQQYWSDQANTPKEDTAVVETGQRLFTVKVVDASGDGLNNVRVYAFNAKKQYAGIYGNTNADGKLALDIPDGSFTFRADYRGQQYWSEQVETPHDDDVEIETEQRSMTVKVVDADGEGLEDVRVYAFNDKKQYVGLYGNTDDDGKLQFDIPEGKFFFRADYRGYQYWSDQVNAPDDEKAVIEIEQTEFTVQVVDEEGEEIEGVNVYAFNAKKQYTGVYGRTDKKGKVEMDLPPGNFMFRADYKGQQYWTAVFIIPDTELITIQTK